MKLSRTPLIVAIGAMMALVACGSATEADQDAATTTASIATTTTDAPTTTVAPTTTSSVTQESTSLAPDSVEAIPLSSVVGGSIRGDGWLVEPGRYSTELGERVFAFTIPEPVIYYESDIRITFGPDTSSQVTDKFFLTEFVGVVPAERAAEHASHDPVVPTYALAMPTNLGTWLSSISQLSTGEELELSNTAGLTGRAWDVEVDSTNGGTFHCPFGECIGSLVQETEGVWVLFEDARFRIWQLTGDVSGVFGFLQSRPDTFPDMVALAETILKDLDIDSDIDS